MYAYIHIHRHSTSIPARATMVTEIEFDARADGVACAMRLTSKSNVSNGAAFASPACMRVG